MDESVARTVQGADTQSFDMADFEARMRGSQPRLPGPDPLVGLADLSNEAGQADDPFAALFADPAAARALSGSPAGQNSPATAAVSRPPAPTAYHPAEPVQQYSGGAYEELSASQISEPAAARRPPAPAAEGVGVDEAAYPALEPPVSAADEGIAPQYPDEAPDMLRSVAAQMREPGVPAIAGQSPGEYYQQDLQPAYDAPAQIGASAGGLALRGAAVPQAYDPVDEFERSVAALVAERTAANGYAIESQTADFAAAVPAVPAAAEVHGSHDFEPQQDYGSLPAEEEYASGSHEPKAPAAPPAWPEDFGMQPSDGLHPADPDAAGGRSAAMGPATEPRRSRKTLYLTSSAVVVLLAGIGASFALWGSGETGGKVPVITASGAVLKVKPEGGANKAVRTVSVLKPGQTAPAKSKVVTAGEQPIDLAQVAAEPKKARRIKEEELSKKLNLSDRNLMRRMETVKPQIKSRTRSGGYFPEPRKVRTVLVRPDGTLIDPTASISAAKPGRSAARPKLAPAKPVAASSRTSRPVAAAPQRKVKPRVPATARAAATRPAAAVARRPARNNRGADRSADGRTAALDLNRVRSRSAAAGAGSGGRYVVQLAAPGSENAARSVARKMKTRFGSVLGGRTPSVHRAVVKSRTVYRVRVTGLSRTDASRMCSRLKSRGGRCFVARN